MIWQVIRTTSLIFAALYALTFHGQADFQHYTRLFEARWTLQDLPTEFHQTRAIKPLLKNTILAPDELELAFEPWNDQDSMENVVMQWYLRDNMRNFQRMGWLYDGFGHPLRSELQKRNLPIAFACLPLMLTAGDASYVGPGGRAGLWALSTSEIEGNSTNSMDRRHLIEWSNQFALDRLEAIHTQYPEDPLMVLWTYLHRGEHPLGSTPPEPGVSSAFDAWITLFRVTARLLENFNRPSARGEWILMWSSWETVSCPGHISRSFLRKHMGWNRRDQQTWMPAIITMDWDCDIWEQTELSLPPHLAARWNSIQWPLNKDDIHSDWVPIEHVVQPGETLGSIARLHGVSLTEIIDWNGLENTALQADQTLYIHALR